MANDLTDNERAMLSAEELDCLAAALRVLPPTRTIPPVAAALCDLARTRLAYREQVARTECELVKNAELNRALRRADQERDDALRRMEQCALAQGRAEGERDALRGQVAALQDAGQRLRAHCTDSDARTHWDAVLTETGRGVDPAADAQREARATLRAIGTALGIEREEDQDSEERIVGRVMSLRAATDEARAQIAALVEAINQYCAAIREDARIQSDRLYAAEEGGDRDTTREQEYAADSALSDAKKALTQALAAVRVTEG